MLYFVAPDPASFVSGGNRFNQQIMQGLDQLRVPMQRIEFDLVYTALESLSNIVLIDSIYVDQLDASLIQRAKAKTVLLIHLLPSMLSSTLGKEPGLLNSFDLILANSVFTQNYCRSVLGLNNGVAIVEPFTFKPFLTSHGRRNKIVCIANWSPGKQIDKLLSVLSLHDLPGDFIIHFYGDHEREKKYFDLCTSILKLHPILENHVMLHGIVDHEKLHSVYSEASLFIDTSALETYGMAVAEAIAYEIPVITLGKGNVPNLIQQVNGFICHDMDELFNCMMRHHMGDMAFDTMDSSHLLTDWSAFIHQLRLLQPLH